jgi:hypothetical protein
MSKRKVRKREGREKQQWESIRVRRSDVDEVNPEGGVDSMGRQANAGAELWEGGVEDAFLVAPRIFLGPEVDEGLDLGFGFPEAGGGGVGLMGEPGEFEFALGEFDVACGYLMCVRICGFVVRRAALT